MSFSWLLGFGNKNRKRGTEQLEAEAKILHVKEEQLRNLLAKEDAQKVFEGTVITTWFKKSLLERINARVRMAVDLQGKKTFVWTIKSHTPENAGGILKNKHKRQESAESFQAAKKALVKELGHMGVVTTPSFLTTKLTVEKLRTSYVCQSGACAGVRLDFDVLIAVDGEPLESPLPILEIEDVSPDVVSEKERRMLGCAKSLGLTIDEEYSSLSTRKLLNKLGYR